MYTQYVNSSYFPSQIWLLLTNSHYLQKLKYFKHISNIHISFHKWILSTHSQVNSSHFHPIHIQSHTISVIRILATSSIYSYRFFLSNFFTSSRLLLSSAPIVPHYTFLFFWSSRLYLSHLFLTLLSKRIFNTEVWCTAPNHVDMPPVYMHIQPSCISRVDLLKYDNDRS